MLACGIMALLTSLLCWMIIKLPGLLSFISAILWGTALITGASCFKFWQWASIVLFNLTLFIILSTPYNSLIYLLFFGISAIAMSYMASKNIDYYSIQKIGVIMAVLGVSLVLGFTLLSDGDLGIKNAETALISYMEQSFANYETSGLMDFYEQSGITQAEIEEYLYKIAQDVAWHLPALYYFQALMAVFLMLFLAAYLNQKYDIGRLKKKHFYQEVMPWQLVWVIILGLALWLLGNTAKSALYYAGSNILVIMTPIAVYYGLAATIYKTKRQIPSIRNLTIIVLVFLTLVFPLSVVFFLAAIGILDSLLDYRKLHDIKEDIQ